MKFNNRLAEIAKDYLYKGAKICVKGKITTCKWQDIEGSDQYTTEIIAYELQMLDRKSQYIKHKKLTAAIPDAVPAYPEFDVEFLF